MSEHGNNNHNFTPHTVAGQFLQSQREGTAYIVGAGTPITLEALRGIELASLTNAILNNAATTRGAPTVAVELYDHERDAVFSPQRTIKSWLGRNVLRPAGAIRYGEEGDMLHIGLAMDWHVQKPSVTAHNLLEQTKEKTGKLAVKAKAVGSVVHESLHERYEQVVARPDEMAFKAAWEAARTAEDAATAINFVCMQLIAHYTEHRSDIGNSQFALTSAIRQDYPDLLENPHFKTAARRFGKNPEKFKQEFSAIPEEDKEAIIAELPCVPAFHEFIEQYNLNTEELFGGAL